MNPIILYFLISLISGVIILGFGLYAYFRKNSLSSLIYSLILTTLYIAHSIVTIFYYSMYFSHILGMAIGLLTIILSGMRIRKSSTSLIIIAVLSLGCINIAYYGGILHSLYYQKNSMLKLF